MKREFNQVIHKCGQIFIVGQLVGKIVECLTLLIVICYVQTGIAGLVMEISIPTVQAVV